MGRTDGHGVCKGCGTSFGYCLIHNGFNDSAFAYCDGCGTTALFDGWSKAIPVGVNLKVHGPIGADLEAFIRPCGCGERFSGTASPRCSRCRVALDAGDSAEVFERDAPGTAKGWRWQRTWAGLYAVIVDDRVVQDPWISEGAG
jgi:hypothetical protein